MKTTKLTLITFLLGISSLFANIDIAKAVGKVKDEQGNAVAYASVELYSKGESVDLVSGSLSDEQGNFIIENINNGTYEIVIIAVGYDEFVKEITINSRTTDLGIFTLKSSAVVELKGAEVRGETSTYRNEIDKRVVDVGKDLVSAGANAADVLQNVPSLSVDQQTGQLSLRGNENVKVMVDGKPSNIPTAQLLKQLPSNSIKSVEIITNASAKYDPEGNSGIINIITYKNKRKGYNGSIDLGFTQGRKSRYNSSINANLNTGSFNFFGNYNANLGKNLFKGSLNNTDTQIRHDFDMLSNNTSQMAKLGFDWFISEKTALTVYTTQFFNNSTGDNQSNFLDFSTNTLYKNIANTDGEYNNQDYSLNFKQDFGKEDHNIVLDAIYSKSNSEDTRDFTNQYPVDVYVEEREYARENLRVNLDYTNQIIDGGKIETGVQFRQEKTGDSLLSSQTVPLNPQDPTLGTFNPSSNYDFTRNIYSAYANYGQKFGKLGVQLGLRVENVDETSDFNVNPVGLGAYENNYFEYYPSAFLTYELAKRSQLSLNYSKRVDRPSVGQISPVPEWNTTTIRSIGNPDLQPQFTHSFELGYLQRFKGGNIYASAQYRMLKDQIARFVELDPLDDNVTLLQYVNYDNVDAYGFELSANYRPTKWWSFNASFDIYQNTIIEQGTEVKARPYNFRVNNTFKLYKNLSLQNFVMYRGKFKFLQGEMQDMWRVDLGARLELMDGKATLSARVSDIFKTFFAESHLTNPQTQIGQFKWEAHTLYVGFSYNFGGEVRKRDIKQESNQQSSGGGIGF